MALKDAFSLALCNLLGIQRGCEDLQQAFLDDVKKEFLWLDEIYETACSAFSVKSKKLEQMPKTPSAKNKMQKRKRKIAEAISEEDSTPISSKPRPTKLKFDIETEESEDTEKTEDTNTGRPMRRCRASKTVAKSKPAPRQSTRRQAKKQTEQSTTDGSVSTTSQDSPSLGRSSRDKTGDVSTSASKSDATVELPPAEAKRNTAQATLSGNSSEDSSPSVRARARAYEVMLEKRLTPNSPCGTKTTARGLAPAAVTSPATQSVADLRPDQNEALHVTPKSSSHVKNAKKPRRSSKNTEKESPKNTAAPRPARTRLRLNKQQAPEPTTEESSDARSETHQDSDAGEDSMPSTSETETHASKMESTEQEDSDDEVIDSSLNCQKSPAGPSNRQSLSETQVIISEVYELHGKAEVKLQSYEVVKTKTTPVANMSKLVSNQPVPRDKSFTIAVVDEAPGDSCDSNKDKSPQQEEQLNSDEAGDQSPGRSTRTRTRARVNADHAKTEKPKENKDSGVHTRMSGEKANSTFTADSDSGSDEGVGRSTRTRARQQKEGTAAVTEAAEEEPVQSTRTRARVQKEESASTDAAEEEPLRSTRTRARVQKEESASSDAVEEEPVRSTRTRQRAQDAAAAEKTAVADGKKQSSIQATKDKNAANVDPVHASDADVVKTAAPHTPPSSRRGSKRLVDHGRGLSPAPKRARSIVGEELADARPLSTSSPINAQDEARDQILSASKPTRPYKFSNAQRNTSGFLNRTPGFSHNSSKMISFLNTPTSGHPGNGVMRSFLKKTSPSPQPTSQMLLEQRKKKLLEKQERAAEKIKKAEEERKRRAEENKRHREERFQKVAAAKQHHVERQKRMEEEVRKKLGTTAMIKEKMKEDREKEEAEKRKQRHQKQIEADLRRKQEEEEKQRKRLEQEEEARLVEEMFQKKRKHEEQLRKQRIAEEKQRKEERFAEKEQRMQEERAKILQMQREKDLMMEQMRLQKENQMLQERVERERIEKEKRLEKERKLREEMEKLKAMEQERLLLKEQELQKQREAAAKERELKQMISNHNKTVMTHKQPQQPASTTTKPVGSVLNTTQTLNSSKSHVPGNSYEMTPVKKTGVSKNYNPDNYDIEDRSFEDSSEDDEAPKKKIPEWAMGVNLSTALIKQFSNPPDVQAIFQFCFTPPNLEEIFGGTRKRRYKERTSSAIWNTPPMKYC